MGLVSLTLKESEVTKVGIGASGALPSTGGTCTGGLVCFGGRPGLRRGATVVVAGTWTMVMDGKGGSGGNVGDVVIPFI